MLADAALYGLELAWLILAVVPLGAGLCLLWSAYGRYRVARRELVAFECQPLAWRDAPPAASDQLLRSLAGVLEEQSARERLLGAHARLSLELVATPADGVRYLVATDAELAPTVQRLLTSYLPDGAVRRVAVTAPELSDHVRLCSVSQRRHFAYPLRTTDEAAAGDPLTYLTTSLSHLEAGETMAVQLVLRPAQSRLIPRLRARLARNEDIRPQLNGSLWGEGVLSWLRRLISGGLDVLDEVLHADGEDRPRRQSDDPAPASSRTAVGLTPIAQAAVEAIHEKLHQPLLTVDYRVLIVGSTEVAVRERTSSLRAALALYDGPSGQQLVVHQPGGRWRRRQLLEQWWFRLPARWVEQSLVLATSEVAALYHAPDSRGAASEQVARSLSRTLPAPRSLQARPSLDVRLGENVHQGKVTPIGLTAAERERHVYIVGGTGNGKTTMLLYSIMQDIRSGKGLAVIDPHGDLAETILEHLPADRRKDLIYCNPDDLERPLGINLLELPDGLTGDELLREKDMITESVVSIMRKLFSDADTGGHRVEYVLRNTIQTALTVPGATLFTIFDLLNNAKYRRRVVRELADPNLRNFWKFEIGKAGDFQRVKMSAGITAKIGRFLFSASARTVLEQKESAIDFGDVMDSGKILICNFSKGKLGEDTSALFGTTILAKLQLAALRRARLSEGSRRPFYVYVDEFQNFATMSFVQMLSEARKYKLLLTMAEQSTAQQDQQRLVNVMLANVGTVVCFRSGSPADEQMLLPLFRPFLEPGEMANLPAYSFYVRIAAVQPQEPMSGRTVLVE